MMTDRTERTFTSDFKRFFLQGLVVLLPSVLTLWIVVKAYQFVDNAIAEPINGWVRVGLVQLGGTWKPLQDLFDPDPAAVQKELQLRQAAGRNQAPERVHAEMRAEKVRQWWAERWYLDFIGLVIAVVMVYVAGRLLGGFVGRRVYRMLERFITALPVFKQVYPYVRQVVDFLFSSERPMKFSRVVLVEYPRKGIWSIGFLTSGAMKSVSREAGDSVTVFMPSSPTPFTGYTTVVPRKDAVELPMTVEEAIRFLVTGGVLIPDHQRMESPGAPGQGPPSPAATARMLAEAAGAGRGSREAAGGS